MSRDEVEWKADDEFYFLDSYVEEEKSFLIKKNKKYKIKHVFSSGNISYYDDEGDIGYISPLAIATNKKEKEEKEKLFLELIKTDYNTGQYIEINFDCIDYGRYDIMKVKEFFSKRRQYKIIDYRPYSSSPYKIDTGSGEDIWVKREWAKQVNNSKIGEKMSTKQEEKVEWKVGDEFEFKAEEERFAIEWEFSLDKTYTVLSVDRLSWPPKVQAKNDNGSIWSARFYRIQKPTRNVQMKEKGQSEVVQGVAKVVSPKMAEIEDLLSFLNLSQQAKTKLLGLFQDEIMNVRQQAVEDFKRKIQDVVG